MEPKSIQWDLSFIFFSTKNVLKTLGPPRICSILLLAQFTGFNKHRYFHSRSRVGPSISYYIEIWSKAKSLLERLLPIPMKSIGPRNEYIGRIFWVDCFAPVFYKRKKISESGFPGSERRVLVYHALNLTGVRGGGGTGSEKRGIWLKISNETVAGIDISFKEKDIISEFSLCILYGYPIARAMIGKWFDQAKHKQLEFGTAIRKLSERLDFVISFAFREKYQLKWRRAISLQNGAQCLCGNATRSLVGLGEESHESDFLRKISKRIDLVRQGWLVNRIDFYSKVRRYRQYSYDSTRASFVQRSFDSIRKEDSEYHYNTLRSIKRSDYQQLKERSFFGILPFQTEGREIESDRFPKYLSGYSSCPGYSRNKAKNFFGILQEPFVLFSDRWSELHLGSNPTERPLGIKINKMVLLSLPGDRKIKEIVNIFKKLRIYKIPSQFILFHSDRDVIRFRRMNWIWTKMNLFIEGSEKLGPDLLRELFLKIQNQKVVVASNNIGGSQSI
ncbi:hypothetical protein HID58_090121 [Brassica napus]|uniref:Ycf2 N-terminal domain-containing protein n=1 Tax=Brassica napus TaxID=3708 RepID=A0ABQ7XGG0_BRANA|nr:hypothetical protein HID58_090121 [Brassica napus]